MSVQKQRRIGVAVFCILALDVSAAAADCLPAPNSSAPANSHWYYRTDRAQQRKCWYLGAADKILKQDPAQIATGSAPAKPLRSERAESTYSLGSFKDFIKHRKDTDLSNEDVEKLYAQFLEWNRHTKN